MKKTRVAAAMAVLSMVILFGVKLEVIERFFLTAGMAGRE